MHTQQFKTFALLTDWRTSCSDCLFQSASHLLNHMPDRLLFQTSVFPLYMSQSDIWFITQVFDDSYDSDEHVRKNESSVKATNTKFILLWKSSIECLKSGCSLEVPTMPVKCLPIQGHGFVRSVLHPAPMSFTHILNALTVGQPTTYSMKTSIQCINQWHFVWVDVNSSPAR